MSRLQLSKKIDIIKSIERKRRECVDNHQKMWRYIRDETIRQDRCISKTDYLYKKDTDGDESKYLTNSCFCCQFAVETSVVLKHSDCEHMCEYCPVKWDGVHKPKNFYNCEHKKSSYNAWYKITQLKNTREESDIYDASDAAARIANLPERRLSFWLMYIRFLFGI